MIQPEALSALTRTSKAADVDDRVVVGVMGIRGRGDFLAQEFAKGILSGRDLHDMSDGALLKRVGETDVFAEVEPNQKERILIVNTTSEDYGRTHDNGND